jgi:hypothetical protein
VPMLGRRGAIALTCAAALLVPAAAHANAFDDTLKEYTQTGAVDGCKHTADELAQAKAQTPKGIAQTAPGYPAQLAVAAEKRAKGCTKQDARATSTAAAATPPATTTTAPDATQPPAATPTTAPAPGATTQPPVAAPTTAPAAAAGAATKSAADDGAAVALIVAGALVLMLLVLWAAARWWAWEPRWLAGWRHATAEAGWRASAAWAEFTDWLRLGR